MTLTFNEVAQILGLPSVGEDMISGISIDSRKTEPGDLFCAIVGARTDGHEYAKAAVKRGAVAILATKPIENVGVPVFLCGQVEHALAKISKTIRATFSGAVIGVTGSVGKTTVKEYIAAALGPELTLKTEGNLNTEYGVPQTWMKLKSENRYAVIEMAMRGSGQIAHLCSFSMPTIGVITSIGSAHVGELGSIEKIANAKAELLESLPTNGMAIIPRDAQQFEMLRRATKCDSQSFGFHEDADWRVVEWTSEWTAARTRVQLRRDQQEMVFWVPGIGASAASNAAAAIAAAVAAGKSLSESAEGIRRAQVPAGRMKLGEWNGAVLLLDLYNSSPESCAEALKNMSKFPADGRRVALLGDMLELGAAAEELHREVGKLAAKSGLTELHLVGPLSRWIGESAEADGFVGEIKFYEKPEEALAVIRSLRRGDLALLKASRSVELERALPSEVAQRA